MTIQKSTEKLTLSKNKDTLTLSGFNRDDILKKLTKEDKGGLITRKGETPKGIVMDANSGLSFEEKQKRMRAVETRASVIEKQPTKPKLSIEEEALNTAFSFTEVETQKSKPTIISSSSVTQDALNTAVKIDIKQKTTTEEVKSPSFAFKQSENLVSLEDITPEDKTIKVDNRDKTLIEQMMKHYKYLEFDSEEEIAQLQKGLELRQTLENNRKDASSGDEDDDIVVNSSSSDLDEGAVKIRREAYFSRHNRKSNKKRTIEPNFLQRDVEIYDKNIVIDVARAMAVKVDEFIKKLRYYGLNVKENDIIDGDATELVVEEMGHIAKRVTRLTAEDKIVKIQSSSKMLSVAPVVTIMGHVDHGKTTLLDALRQTKVAEREAGGITQHISAYQTEVADGKKITFIDTPGHEAFTGIRMRGASLTHVIVIVVAADDGIMPQTIESIKHAKNSKVPIVIAINKIDRPNANIQKIKNELLAFEVVTDDLGGDTLCVPISAKTGENLDKLCDAILLQAEVYGAKAEFDAPASGVVLEGRLDKQRGVASTLLVQNGTLKVGDIILIDSSYSKIRLLVNDKGESIHSAEPSTPVEVYGLPDVPSPGKHFNIIESEKLAREIAEHRKDKKTEQKGGTKEAFANFFTSKTKAKQVNVVIRSDVQSTIDAIKYAIDGIKLPSEIEIKIMQASVGDITEADIKFAKLHDAVVFAFSVKCGSREEELARKTGVVLKQHAVIYNIIDDIKEIISSKLSPIVKDEVIGDIEVREVFDIFKVGKIAGSFVKKGVVRRNSVVKIFRDGKEIGEGKLKTLKHFKENVKELAQGNECGIQIEGFEGFKPNDMLQIIERTEEKRVL